jgi:hypothetical protein
MFQHMPQDVEKGKLSQCHFVRQVAYATPARYSFVEMEFGFQRNLVALPLTERSQSPGFGGDQPRGALDRTWGWGCLAKRPCPQSGEPSFSTLEPCHAKDFSLLVRCGHSLIQAVIGSPSTIERGCHGKVTCPTQGYKRGPSRGRRSFQMNGRIWSARLPLIGTSTWERANPFPQSGQ